MLYTIDQSVESPIMLIDNHIGFNDSDGQGIDGSLFQRELMSLDGQGKKSIQCWMNTPGGNVYNGWMMVNAILKSKTPVDTYNIGMIASMGFPVFMAGRKRIMMDYAIAMIHMPFNIEDPENPDPMIMAMCESMVKMVTSKSKLSEAKVREMLEAETWLTAEQCLEYGFCTEIESTSDLNKKWMPSNDTSVEAVWRNAKKIAASVIPINQSNQNSSDMKLVTAKLGLNEAATESNVVDAIRSIEAKAEQAQVKVIEQENKHKTEMKAAVEKAAADVTAATTAKAAAETEAATAKTSLAAKETAYNELKVKYDALETEKNTAIANQKKAAAETMVNEVGVKTGRIKNDNVEEFKKAVAKWVDLAVADHDGTKAMIESLPLNKTAQKIETIQTNEKTNKVIASASFKMLEIANKHKQVPQLNIQ